MAGQIANGPAVARRARGQQQVDQGHLDHRRALGGQSGAQDAMYRRTVDRVAERFEGGQADVCVGVFAHRSQECVEHGAVADLALGGMTHAFEAAAGRRVAEQAQADGARQGVELAVDSRHLAAGGHQQAAANQPEEQRGDGEQGRPRYPATVVERSPPAVGEALVVDLDHGVEAVAQARARGRRLEVAETVPHCVECVVSWLGHEGTSSASVW